MSQKSRSTRKDDRPARDPEARAARRQRVLNVAGAAVSFATTVAVVATIVVGHGPLMARAAELKQTELKVAFDWPPLAGRASSRTADGKPATWMSQDQRDLLEKMALRLLAGDPFDRASIEQTQVALRETGWFMDGGGPWLRRLENGVVVIGGRWRTPVAAVRTAAGDRLVTRDGEALPLVYPIGRSSLPVVVGVTDPEPAPGAKWPGRGLGEVLAGLKLAAFLGGMPGADQIAGVDVSEYAASKRLVVLTTTGGRIVWGGPPDEFLPGQAPAQTKRQRLVAVFQQFGQLDAGRDELDLRSEDGVYTLDTTRGRNGGEPSAGKPTAKGQPGGKNRR